jgi:dTDP-L-rhamnose 4-epimerase
VLEVAELMSAALGKSIPPQATGTYRVGDIRHCVADISLAHRVLGYEPAVTLDDGIVELTEWLREQRADDRVAQAGLELASRGLAR